MKKYINIEDYNKDWNKIFIQLFGKELFNTLKKTPIKSFAFKLLNNTYPKDYDSLKELFSNQKNIDYHVERGKTALDFLFMAGFYYGMQGSYEWKVKPAEERLECLQPLVKKLLATHQESGVKIEI